MIRKNKTIGTCSYLFRNQKTSATNHWSLKIHGVLAAALLLKKLKSLLHLVKREVESKLQCGSSRSF
jgi:hypothetical protein